MTERWFTALDDCKAVILVIPIINVTFVDKCSKVTNIYRYTNTCELCFPPPILFVQNVNRFFPIVGHI